MGVELFMYREIKTYEFMLTGFYAWMIVRVSLLLLHNSKNTVFSLVTTRNVFQEKWKIIACNQKLFEKPAINYKVLESV